MDEIKIAKDGAIRPRGTYRSLVIPACDFSGTPAVYLDLPYYARRRKFLPAIKGWVEQVYVRSFGELRWINLRRI